RTPGHSLPSPREGDVHALSRPAHRPLTETATAPYRTWERPSGFLPSSRIDEAGRRPLVQTRGSRLPRAPSGHAAPTLDAANPLLVEEDLGYRVRREDAGVVRQRATVVGDLDGIADEAAATNDVLGARVV